MVELPARWNTTLACGDGQLAAGIPRRRGGGGVYLGEINGGKGALVTSA